MSEFWKRWWMVIVPSVVLFIISISPLLIYEYGCFRLAQEIAWLKDHGRPTSWEEFYRKYPLTPEDSPEYQQLQKAVGLMPSADLKWSDEEWFFFSGMGKKPLEDKNTIREQARKNLQTTAEFRACMYKLLEMPPVVMKDYDFFLSYNFKVLEKMRLFIALDNRDYVEAATAVNNIYLSYQQLNPQNLLFESVFKLDLLLKFYEVPESSLRQWQNSLRKRGSAYIRNLIIVDDCFNISYICKPVETFIGHSYLKPSEYPAMLKFTIPLWKARQLTMMREGEHLLHVDKYITLRERRLPWYIIPVAMIEDVCRLPIAYDDLNYSFFVNYQNDDNHLILKAKLNGLITDTGIAAELYRRKYGKLPETLADMVPEFIPRVPINPFESKPVEYIKTSEDEGAIGTKNNKFTLSPRKGRVVPEKQKKGNGI